MKKAGRLLISAAIGLAVVSTTVYAANEPSKPSKVIELPEKAAVNGLPDKATIKELRHYKKIKELTDGENQGEVKKYVKGLSEKELFETAAEMIEGSADFEREGMILVPEIKEKWKNGPSENAHKMLSDKGYSTKFRAHVLDAMLSNGIAEKSMANPTIVNEITAVINDASEDEMLRAYSLKKLKAHGNIDHKKLNLENIVFDNSESKEVRGAAIVAMNRTKDPSFEKALDRIIKNKEVKDETLLEYAIVESAKGKKANEYRKEIKDIVKETKSSNLKGTITYAMAITGDKESIKLAVESYDESEPEISFYTFRNRMNTVIELLKSSNKEDVKAGIKASMYGQVANALPLIEELQKKSSDPEVQTLASEALKIIDPTYLVDEAVLEKEGK